VDCFIAGLGGRETHPDDPPAARSFAGTFYLGKVAPCGGDSNEDLGVHVQSFDAAPSHLALAGTAQTLCKESAGVRNVW
jgi:hypothetical protein